MVYFDNEDDLRRLLEQAYTPISPPLGVKERIRKSIPDGIYCSQRVTSIPWAKPKLVVPIMASIAAGLIAYGYWLSTTFI